ncbi:leucine-rich repeat receptor-like protein kinase TDR [Beta vulgaris subsp. vulgaris]|uniref:leucine-rich repeat receptor-like protein kinase TDR n=1 Tax=Beta vulgaris subsp. vulgaris TaxID=3555 RepID=UPI00053F920F|nr:leucine-rich repeat receptor-like protein kinase TDR [Beta vulgaris subsp. vulgaris]
MKLSFSLLLLLLLPSFKKSPVFLCFFFTISPLLVQASPPPLIPIQVFSLLSLKSSLNDPQNSLQSWNPTQILSNSSPLWCSWSGIKCAQNTSLIISLDLSSRNLSGEIPPEIRHLSSLKNLNLSKNSFEGNLPTSIFELSELRILDISHNNYNSTFPDGISKLKFLRHLNCYSNSFIGSLPLDLTGNQNLEYLNLGGSYFIGSIPAEYGGFPRLNFLYLAGNMLNGSIPSEFGLLTQLQHVEMGYNNFDGYIPKELGMLSNLEYLDISNCSLSGIVPQEIGNLTSLATLLLFSNNISGVIPSSFSNLKGLQVFDLSNNKLSGSIPEGISELKKLSFLSLLCNELSGNVPEGVGDLPLLEFLLLWNNALNGSLPSRLGTNGRLQKLDVSSNRLTGFLPEQLCSGNTLEKLILFNNGFSGELPRSLVNCSSLLRVRIENNMFNGSIPFGFGQLPNLTFMDVSKNNFSGKIPSDLGIAPKLSNLNVSENFFGSELPDGIWGGPSLQIFSASFSGISGKIPDFKGCKSVYQIEMEGNSLNGPIPWDIGHCEKLIALNLKKNMLTGIIPWEISTLPSINVVDLSYNNLSGSIPSNFDNCGTLEIFNVSFNRLTGAIPSSGSIFPNLHPSSFMGNEGLCGNMLGKPCVPGSPVAGAADASDKEPRKTAGAIVWIMAAAFGVGLFVLIAGSRCFHANYSRKFSEGKEIGPWKLTAFQRLNFTADDVLECLAMSDKIIGMGATGTVYRAEMPSGDIIAIKKLWGKQKETLRRRKGVLAEVEVLGNVRHRNIVRLLGCCSNKESTLLLYEYMPNGSLDDLLHGKNKGENLVADWLTRYKIAFGVAQGISYLHHDCDPVIVHRDLKPSNILLDAEMEARVADFGVAKLIESDESMSVIAGSYGYIAPEYAYTLQVDEKSDIYSYGVLLLEILCGKRSVDSEFGEGNSVVDWVRTKIKMKNGIHDILDKNAGSSCTSVREEMMLVLKVALLCTSRNPADRPSMRDVITMLQEAKPKRKSPTLARGESGDHVIEINGCDDHDKSDVATLGEKK